MLSGVSSSDSITVSLDVDKIRTVASLADFVVFVGHALTCVAGGIDEAAPHSRAVALWLSLCHVLPVHAANGLPTAPDGNFGLSGLFHDGCRSRVVVDDDGGLGVGIQFVQVDDRHRRSINRRVADVSCWIQTDVLPRMSPDQLFLLVVA